MIPLLKKPWIWFLPHAVLVVGLFPEFKHFEVATSGDSETFLSVSQVSFREYLETEALQMIPYGYPLFLRGVRAVSENLEALPRLQLAVHWLAVLVLFGGLRGVLASEWLAFSAASSVLYSNVALLHGQLVMSDALGSSCAVAAVGLLLVVVRRPTNLAGWAALALCVTLAYQCRAAYLFLIPLFPVLGVLVAGLVLPRERWKTVRLGLALGLLALGVVPLLTYCTVRWHVTGRFGFLSMGDLSLFGIAGQILSDDLVPELPEEAQPLAREFVNLRRFYILRHLKVLPDDAVPPEMADDPDQDRAPLPNLPKGLGKGTWDPYLAEMSEGIAYLEPGGLADIFQRTQELKFQSGTFAYSILLLGLGRVQPLADHTNLAALNSAVLRLRPGAYLGYVVMTLRMGLTAVLLNGYLFNALLTVLAALLLAWHVAWLVQRLRGAETAAARPPQPGQAGAFQLLLLLAGAFALTNILQLSLVTLATLRYTDAAGVLLPTTLVAPVAALWHKVRSTLRTS